MTKITKETRVVRGGKVRGGPQLMGRASRVDDGRRRLVLQVFRSLLGENIRRARERRDVAVTELAAAIGAHPDTIRQWERGEKVPKWSAVIKVSLAIDCPLSDLVPGEVRNVTIVRESPAAEIERRRAAAVDLLRRAGGLVCVAADLAGIKPNTMSHRLRRLGVRPPRKLLQRDPVTKRWRRSR